MSRTCYVQGIAPILHGLCNFALCWTRLCTSALHFKAKKTKGAGAAPSIVPKIVFRGSLQLETEARAPQAASVVLSPPVGS